MKKKELIKSMAKDAGISEAKARKALESIVDIISKELKKKDKKVTLVGFGTFRKEYRKTRKGRNPQTGDVIKIKGKYVVKFSAGKRFKTAMSGGGGPGSPKK